MGEVIIATVRERQGVVHAGDTAWPKFDTVPCRYFKRPFVHFLEEFGRGGAEILEGGRRIRPKWA